jgi:hypothetical protein
MQRELQELRLPKEWLDEGIPRSLFDIPKEDQTLKNVINRRLMPLLIALYHSGNFTDAWKG